MQKVSIRTGMMAAIALCLPWGLTGCAGNGNGLDQNGQPLAAGSGGGGTLTASFDSIQSTVFTPICSACHIGATAPEGLRLDAADSYDQLVDVPSAEDGALLRIEPGNPDGSYLIQKLEGHAAVGARMPYGGPYLATDVVAVIRAWIAAGAPRAAAAAAEPTGVVAE